MEKHSGLSSSAPHPEHGEVDSNEKECACGMCLFLAEPGSKYCKHHRSIQEQYDRKQQKEAGGKP